MYYITAFIPQHGLNKLWKSQEEQNVEGTW